MTEPTAMVVDLATQKLVATLDLLNNEAPAGVSHEVAVIAADTVVWTEEGEPLGKPADRDAGRTMLHKLLGRRHTVTTGVAVARYGESTPLFTFSSSADVHMRELDVPAIEAYLDSDEPWDKAGGYAVQGLAGAFISRIEGSWHAVVGLPVSDLLVELTRHGLLDKMPWQST